MPEAYIYDAVRTPRGKGKSSGALHEITALSLGTQVLQAIRDRNNLDTSKVDDVVFGCVSPVGEQGAGFAQAFGFDVAGGVEHLLHAGAAFGAFVADDDDVACLDAVVEDVIDGLLLRFGDVRFAAENVDGFVHA
jgi:hypothetical protein